MLSEHRRRIPSPEPLRFDYPTFVTWPPQRDDSGAKAGGLQLLRHALHYLRSSPLAAVVVLLSTASTAAPANEEPIRLAYEGPASCGGLEELWTKIRARTPRARLAKTHEAGRSFVVRIEVQAHALRGRLTILASGSPPAAREIEAAGCAQVLDGLSLIIALALDPTDRSAETPQPPSTADVSHGDSDRSARPAADSDRARPAADSDRSARSAADSVHATGSSTAAMGPTANTEVTRPRKKVAAQERGTAPAQFEDPLPSNDGTTVWWAALAAYGVSGLGPEWLMGGRAGAEIASTADTYWAPALRLSAGYAGHSGLPTQGATANFAYGFVNLEGCLLRGLLGPVGVRACLAGDLGVEWAWGSDTAMPRSQTRFWADLGPEARVEWAPTRRLRLELGCAALFPLRQDRFLVGPNEIHRVPPVGVAVLLGLSARIP